MSKNRGIKSMPYRINDGDMEAMKIRSLAAVAEAAAPSRRVRAATYVRFSIAVAVGLLLMVVAIGQLVRPTHYDLFIEQLAEMPEEVLYEMEVDIIEYGEEII